MDSDSLWAGEVWRYEDHFKVTVSVLDVYAYHYLMWHVSLGKLNRNFCSCLGNYKHEYEYIYKLFEDYKVNQNNKPM